MALAKRNSGSYFPECWLSTAGHPALTGQNIHSDSGEFTGTLAFRCWHPNKKMLLCYFDTDDGEQFKLPVWWQSWGVNYAPAETHINFVDEVEDGTRWHCVYQKKANGYIRWRRAESID